MSGYIRRIEQLETGLVVASVYRESDLKRVGLKFIQWPPFNQARRLVRAHEWADKWIKNCEKYEVTP